MKRRAVIVDAPDLPPNECEFFITAAGIADTEKVEIPDEKGLDFEVEMLYEESAEEAPEIALTNVKGIGKGTAENLETEGIITVKDLLDADPENLSSKISGISPRKVSEWQNNAKALLEA